MDPILKDILSMADGAFGKWLDYQQQDRLFDVYEQSQQRRYAGYGSSWANPDGTGSMLPLLLIGGAVVAGVLLLAR